MTKTCLDQKLDIQNRIILNKLDFVNFYYKMNFFAIFKDETGRYDF